jgi:hypothetical protein
MPKNTFGLIFPLAKSKPTVSFVWVGHRVLNVTNARDLLVDVDMRVPKDVYDRLYLANLL